MLLPVSDRPNPENYTPWVNYGLIITNVLIFVVITLPLTAFGADLSDPALKTWVDGLLEGTSGNITAEMLEQHLTAYDVFVALHGYKPGAPEISDLLASMFLHANGAHLAGNMLMLWIYGDNVEHRLGRAGYLITYLLAGVAACLFFGALDSASMTPLIGASGAIAGVLGLYFFLFPSNEVRVLILLIPVFFKAVFFKARWVLLFWVVIQNILPMLAGAGGNVAYSAHLGGFFFGLAAGFAASRFVARPKARGDLTRAQFHLKMAKHRLDQGQAVSAYQHVQKALQIDPECQPEADALLRQIPI